VSGGRELHGDEAGSFEEQHAAEDGCERDEARTGEIEHDRHRR
jgi:hypothetical protein